MMSLPFLAKAIEMFLQNLIDRIVEESKNQALGKVTPFIVYNLFYIYPLILLQEENHKWQ
jgi:hypothetical protein